MPLRDPDIADSQLLDNLTGLNADVQNVQAASRKRLTAVEARATALEATAWVAPTLLNSWVNFGAGFNNAGYRKEGTIVRLRGVVKTGTPGATSVVFTLPVGFRPPATELLVVISNDAIGRCDVQSGGSVIATVGSTTYFSLDGISFSIT